MRFAKYHGLGNDFVVVDLRDARAEVSAAWQSPELVRRLCVLNADGSEAEMCGNGIRCVVKELHDRGGIGKDEVSIETGAGRLVCEISASGVTVSMGAPRLLRGEIPMVGPIGE